MTYRVRLASFTRAALHLAPNAVNALCQTAQRTGLRPLAVFGL